MINSQTLAPLVAALRSTQRKTLERGLFAIATGGTLLVVMLYSNVFTQLATLMQPPKSTIYGVWTETDVAPYLAQHIEIRREVVMVDGRVVTTSYQYNGRLLEYRVAGRDYQFLMRNQERTEMTLLSSAHYNPTFQLSEKDKKHRQ